MQKVYTQDHWGVTISQVELDLHGLRGSFKRSERPGASNYPRSRTVFPPSLVINLGGLLDAISKTHHVAQAGGANDYSCTFGDAIIDDGILVCIWPY